MLQKLSDQLRPLLGDRSDDFVRSLISHIRLGEGGVGGFFDRVRAAGFAENLDEWIGGAASQPVSGALAANLLGAGYLSKLASRNRVGVEAATEAAGIALPVVSRLVSGESQPATATVQVTAQNTTEKPNWLWGLAAVVLTGLVAWWAVSWSNSNPLAPGASPTISVEPAASAIAPENTVPSGRDLTFQMSLQGHILCYQGVVPSAMIKELTAELQKVVGKENVSGGLVGDVTRPVAWTRQFMALVQLVCDPSCQVTFKAIGDSVSFSGTVVDKAKFEAKAREILKSGGTTLDFSGLQEPEVLNPIQKHRQNH